MQGERRARRSGLGAFVFGVVLVVLGGYYVLRNAFGFELPELESEVVVPVLAIVLGVVLLARGAGELSARA